MGIKVSLEQEISFEQMGEEFARAYAEEQREFLLGMLYCIRIFPAQGWWPMQCRAITDDSKWGAEERGLVATYLETLAEHLRDPSAAQGGEARDE